MSSQIFKKKIPIDLLFNLLDIICIKNDKYFTFNNTSYKKGIFNNEIQKFIELCKEYYHNSKKNKDLDKKLTYNSLTTVIRQICNFNKIVYTSHIKFDKSTYNIIYFIYYN